MDFRESQPLKACSSICVTVSGIETRTRDVLQHVQPASESIVRDGVNGRMKVDFRGIFRSLVCLATCCPAVCRRVESVGRRGGVEMREEKYYEFGVNRFLIFRP